MRYRLMPLAVCTAALCMSAPAAVAETVDDVVARHVKARGGLAALDAIRTVRIERTVAATFTNIEVVVYKKRPNLYRSEATPKQGTAVTRGFADVAWESVNGKTTIREGAAAVEQRELDADFDGPLVRYREKGHVVTLEGRERAGTTDAWKLKVTTKSGAVRYVYLDAATWLDVRHEGTIEIAPNRRVATTVTFGDWRDVGGVKFPFAIDEERDAPGQTFVTYTKKIDVNVPMDEVMFRPPEP